MATLKELNELRTKLREAKKGYKESDDKDLNNICVIIDLLILATYDLDELDPLFYMLDTYLNEYLGGQN